MTGNLNTGLYHNCQGVINGGGCLNLSGNRGWNNSASFFGGGGEGYYTSAQVNLCVKAVGANVVYDLEYCETSSSTETSIIDSYENSYSVGTSDCSTLINQERIWSFDD